MKTKEEEFVLPQHVRDTAYQDGVDAATRAYADELKPDQNDYKGEYSYPSELRNQIDSWSSPFKTQEERQAARRRKAELEELWFAWLRGWNEGGRDAMIDRLKLPNGKFGPAFILVGHPIMENPHDGKRVVIEQIVRADRVYDSKVYLKGEQYPRSLREVMPERRAEVQDMFQSTQQLIEATEASIEHMQRLLKTLTGQTKKVKR